MELKPFTELDWDAWAGAEGKNPLIGYTYNAAVIVDDNGIGVYFSDEEGEMQSGWQFETRTPKAVAKFINFDIITPKGCEALGFVKVY